MNEQSIFLAALDIADPTERAAYLTRTCDGESTLRRQVEDLLAAHERSGEFLDVPALHQIAAGVAGDERSPEHTSAEVNDVKGDIDLSFLQPSSKSGSLGRLGHYEVEEVIGRGGCGIVLKAFDEILHRRVAVKVMAPELAATSPARKRFLREARAAAAIRHENVVNIHAVEDQPVPFLVMEYIAGLTLQQRLDETGPLDVQEVLGIGQQIAGGLEAAHALGLIHRDIKPGNILLEKDKNRIKITDFGLARAADDASVTQSGTIAGTPLYMSPEQARGDVIDPRSDLFSLGSVLYVMCSGRPPFRAATTLAVLKRVAEDEPRPIQEIIPEVPDWLVAVIAKLHAKKPDDRFASAQATATLLGRCLSELQQHGRVESLGDLVPMIPKPASASQEQAEEKPTPAPESRGPMPRRRWAAAAAVFLALLAGLSLTEASGVTNLRGTVIRLFSPDGTLVVEVDDPGVSVSIDGEEMVITGTGAKEIRLKPGQYKVLASKDGKPVMQELVTVTKNGRQVVRVSKEAAPATVTGKEPKTGVSPASRYKNHLGMEFTLVPKGKAWLGGGTVWGAPAGSGGPGPRAVQFDEDFYLGVYEITQEEWEKVTGLNPSHFSRKGAGKDAVKDIADANLKQFPVERVTWNDAQLFIKRLNERAQEAGWMYRLPTQAEWEYACRGGPVDKFDSAFDYYFDKPTNQLLPEQANCKSLNRPCKVGSYPPNRLGLYDMHGNVSEWCDDVRGGVNKTACEHHGGNWSGGPDWCRANAAFATGREIPFDSVGLRVARVRVATDPDHHAAEWVLRVGGKASGFINGERRELTRGRYPNDCRLTMDSIWLDNTGIADADLANLDGLASLRELRLLHFSGTKTLTNEAVPYLLKLKNLEELSLWGTRLTDAGVERLTALTRLKRLSLSGTDVTDKGLESLAKLPSLTSLDLKSTRVTDAGMVHIAKLAKLETLGLEATVVTDAGLREIGRLPSLKHVDLNGATKVSGPGLVAFIGQLPQLTSLQVSRTGATDEFLLELKARPNLEGLGLGSTRITDAGLENLKDLKHLRWLYLKDTKVSAESVRKLAVALPQCEIVSDYKALKSDADPDRHAAEYALSIGGHVMLNGVMNHFLTRLEELPKEPFRLTWIALTHNQKVGEAGWVNFQGCKNVTNLTLVGTPMPDAALVYFKECKGLSDVNLEGTLVTDAGLTLFENCPGLTSLWLANTKVTDAGLTPFRNCKSLAFLGLTNTQITDAGLATFKDCKNLKILGCTGMRRLTDSGLANFKNCQELEELHLCQTQVGDAGLALFKDCKNLSCLDLIDTRVTDAGLAYFKDNQKLTHVICDKTKVTDKGLAHLKNCRNLTNVNLCRTRVTEAGLVHLKDCNLTLLFLDETPLSDKSIDTISELFRLRIVSLKGTKVTEAGVKKLAAALPFCKIEWNGGVIEPKKVR